MTFLHFDSGYNFANIKFTIAKQNDMRLRAIKMVCHQNNKLNAYKTYIDK